MKNLQAIKQRYGIIGQSELLERALKTAIRVAPTDLTVLITGESGVGKEVFSKIIHALSPRKHNKFIAINCGAIPTGTINSELFGHKKGAFTGASNDRKGYFETVNKGTIFLDEVSELPLDTQAFLLRILESGEFIPVGSSEVLKTDVRVVAASNVDLKERISKGKFREDLYYRLNTVPIQVPALRERKEDILLLFRKFSSDFAERYRIEAVKLDERAQMLLQNYSWSGNIRELKNLAEQVSILSEDRLVTAEMLIDIFPDLLKRNLPMVAPTADSGFTGASGMAERDILYKLLFEMKHDMNELKKLVFELIQSNDLHIPEPRSLDYLVPTMENSPYQNVPVGGDYNIPVSPTVFEEGREEKSAFVNAGSHGTPVTTEVVEESLSLEEMEKDMIRKALKKHRGRRKDAAVDLGISERTLYRKIKQYEL